MCSMEFCGTYFGVGLSFFSKSEVRILGELYVSFKQIKNDVFENVEVRYIFN